MDRTGQTWRNADMPTSWSVALVVRSEYHPGGWEHRVLILDCGSGSGYQPGKTDRWPEHGDEPRWCEGYGYMERVA